MASSLYKAQKKKHLELAKKMEALVAELEAEKKRIQKLRGVSREQELRLWSPLFRSYGIEIAPPKAQRPTWDSQRWLSEAISQKELRKKFLAVGDKKRASEAERKASLAEKRGKELRMIESKRSK